MKQFITFITAVIIAFACSMPAYADTNKDYAKALKKEKKEKLKEYKKGKWELFGSSRTLEVALMKHYNMLESTGEDAYEIVGTVTNCKSKNVGYQMAINNACITYAQQAGSSLKGRVISDMHGEGSDADGEFDHFYGAYERLLEKEIKGEMINSYSIIRTNNGTYEIMVFFVVSENAASKARIRAMETAMKESEFAQKHADQIAKFVREGFNN